MSTLLKDIYSRPFYEAFAGVLTRALPEFEKQEFYSLIFTLEFESYELKERMAHTANVLHHFLSPDFDEASLQVIDIISRLRHSGIKEQSIEYMFIPEYIALYGLEHFESSVSAMEYITQFTSCEYAVRPFLLNYEERMMNQMLSWSNHEDHKVRRLASEGTRPRLPWGKAVPALKKDPVPILTILQKLKKDPSEFVRRSVANNLNDISKDHPSIVLDIANKWLGISRETDAVVRHGCRTLLKQGNRDILLLFGFDSDMIELAGFSIETPMIRIGENLEFTFSIINRDQKIRAVRMEYAIYYKRKNGSRSKKVFKISERDIEPGRNYEVYRKQSFRKITTRMFYSGEHKLSVIINGKESGAKFFELII